MSNLRIIPIDLLGLEKVTEMTQRYSLPPGLRPCIAQMLSRPFSKDDTPDGAKASFFIAVELHRLGLSSEESLRVIFDWNIRNRPPLQATLLRKGIRSAASKPYRLGCGPGVLGDSIFCIGSDTCPYYKNSGQRLLEYSGPWALIDAGWPSQIKRASAMVYLSIQCIERYRKIKPGSVIFVGYRDLSGLSGVNLKYIGPALVELEEAGLIEVKAGRPLGRGKAATEIRRILPIPDAFMQVACTPKENIGGDDS